MANEPTIISPQNDSGAPAKPAPVFRTYAKDIAALGGKPPQDALAPKKTTIRAVPPPTPSVPRKPAPPPPPAYIIPKAPTTAESRESVLARLRATAASAAPAQQPQPPAPPEEFEVLPKAPSTNESRDAVLARLKKSAERLSQIPAPPQRAPLPETRPVEAPTPPPQRPEAPQEPAPIHTYKTDFAQRIDQKQASTFSVLAAQADEGSKYVPRVSEPKRFPIAIIAGFLLIIVGGSAVWFAYKTVTKEPAVVFVSGVPSLIFANERAKLEGSGVELLNALAQSAATALPEGQVRVTYVTSATTSPDGTPIENPLAGGALIAALSLPAPEILIRNVIPSSTVGIVHAGSETRPFFILKVSSYERTFAGMLEWEPRILENLSMLYPEYPQGEATSTSTPQIVPRPAFADEIVENRDVRVLRDTSGRSLLLYGYRDKETLIIARDESAFTELVRRLSTSRGQ